ncbi:MAG: PEP-CTERM system TPR-repeat protein PrsT [Gammaproteobacteria bacterium]|nr:PEP-CTERM system TPR-repeat protein PrsT [Gammaproteobacteria bacterium]
MSNFKKFTATVRYYLLATSLLVTSACSQDMNEQQTMLSAKNHLNEGDPKTASIELRNVLQNNNDNAEARFLLANINLQIGNLEDAKKELLRAKEAGWDAEQIQPKIALILLAHAEYDELLKSIISLDTWSATTRANISGLRAIAEASLGHTALAKTTLKNGASIDPNALHILRATAMFEFSGLLQGDPTGTTEKALSLYPDNIELLFLYAAIDQNNNKLLRASDTYKKIINQDPPNITTLYSQRASINLARLEIALQNTSSAKKILASILKKNENNPEANYLSALLAFSDKDFNLAENHLQKLLALIPDHSLSQQLMGKIKFASKKYEQASQFFIEFLKKVPNDITTQKLLAQTYILLNQSEKADVIVQSLLKQDANDAETLRLQSQLKFIEGDTRAGIQSLESALKTKPDDMSLREQLIKAYITGGKTEQALKEIEAFKTLSNDTETAQKLTISTYVQAGKVNKAIAIAQEILQSKPNDSETLSLNGALYAANNDDKSAREYFSHALREEDKLLSATMGLARIEVKEDNLDEAIELYSGLVDAKAGGALPMLALSELAAKQERPDDMLSWLEKARDTSSTDIKSRIILANYYLRNKQLNKATIYLKEAQKFSPNHAEVLTLQGKLLIVQKRYKEALPPLEKLVNGLANPSSAQVLLSEAYINLGRIKEALTNLRAAVKAQPKNYRALGLLAETELNAGNYEKSLSNAKKLQKERPTSNIGHILEGNVGMVKKNYKNADLAYNKAWTMQHSAQLAIRLYSATTKIKDFNTAIKPLTTWLSDNPDDNDIRLFLAAQYLGANQNDNAMHEYELILKDDPDHGTSLNNLAWLYSLNDNPKSLDLAERAYRLAPENAGIQDTYGWILIQQNQTDKGKRLVRQAMDTLPDDSEIRYHYAVALVNSGDEKKGRQILEQILKQDKVFYSRSDAKTLMDKLNSSK